MPTSAKTVKSRALSSRGAVKHILLVEDDADLTLLLKDYLESYFYQVTTVTNGVTDSTRFWTLILMSFSATW